MYAGQFTLGNSYTIDVRTEGSLIAGGIGHFEDILNFRREDTETKKGARIPEDTLNSVYRQIRSYLLPIQQA